MLSNAELLPMLRASEPIVKHVRLNDIHDITTSPLQPASLDLHVGEIVVPPRKVDGGELEHPREKYLIPSGGSVVVLTREWVNFDGLIGGLMFPKSSKLAERGILLTNCGHVDPGYKGHLRYAVVNLGREAYEIRVGDPVASMCIFRLRLQADPDWSQGRKVSGRRTQDFVRALSPDLLSINRIEDTATRKAEDIVFRSAVWMTMLAAVVAVCVGVVSAGVTLGVSWYSFIKPEIDALNARIDSSADIKRINGAPTNSGADTQPSKSPGHTSPRR